MKLGIGNLVIAGTFTLFAIAGGLYIVWQSPVANVSGAPTTPSKAAAPTPSATNDDAVETVTLPQSSVPAQRVILFDHPYKASTSPAYDAVFAEFFQPQIDELSGLPDSAQPESGYDVFMTEADLNTDGVPEIMGMFFSSLSCGSRGCAFAVYEQTDDGWQPINEWIGIPAEGVYLLPFSTAGYTDIAFGPGELGYGVWRFSTDTNEYGYVGVSATIPQ